MGHAPCLYLLIILVTNFVCIFANLKCEYKGTRQKDVLCSSGGEDYVLRRGLVSDRNETISISLQSCRIMDIEYQAFINLDNLEALDLSNNRLLFLNTGVLDGLTQLKHLNLSFNMLTVLPSSFLDQIVKLEELDLSSNRIESLPTGVFDGTRNLQYIDLSENVLRIQNITNIFDTINVVRYVSFAKNDMSLASDTLLQSFDALEFLDLDRCLLKVVPIFATRFNLKTMKHLKLSTNQINTINNSTTFVNLENLEILNLADNLIVHINDNAFKTLRKLKSIILRGNRISTLPVSLFSDMAKLVTVDLANNNLETVPVNAFRSSTNLKNINLSGNKLTYLQDNFLLELRNSGVILSKFYFHQNSWQCACFLDILKEVKQFAICYNNVKYNGKEAVCMEDEKYCKRNM